MGRDGTCGDKTTSRGITNIFGNEINVVSNLGQQGFVHIRPDDLEPILSHPWIIYWSRGFPLGFIHLIRTQNFHT